MINKVWSMKNVNSCLSRPENAIESLLCFEEYQKKQMRISNNHETISRDSKISMKNLEAKY